MYQDQILAFGVVCGSIWCGSLTLRGEGVSAFKNFMPGVITATLATSAMIHMLLEKSSDAQMEYTIRRRPARNTQHGLDSVTQVPG